MSKFTVMTFNIEGSDYERGDNNWAYTADLNAATIRRQDPDLIGFQELQEGNRAYYAEHLPGYAYELGPLVARENASGAGYHCAIYWRESRFEKLDAGSFFLNETPWVYALHWGVTQGRGVNYVWLRDRQTGLRLLHVNTHLPHDSEEGRVRAAELLLARLPAMHDDDLPTILTADFNTRAVPMRDEWLANVPDEYRARLDKAQHGYMWDNAVYRAFLSAGFKDSADGFLDPDDAHTNTIHGRRGADFPAIGWRIDWILLRDGASAAFSVHETRIIRDAAPPLYASDHYPVVSEVTLTPR
jgi:endonuclease/exonuclease/phosphatase family metal-dependent hydrolase